MEEDGGGKEGVKAAYSDNEKYLSPLTCGCCCCCFWLLFWSSHHRFLRGATTKKERKTQTHTHTHAGRERERERGGRGGGKQARIAMWHVGNGNKSPLKFQKRWNSVTLAPLAAAAIVVVVAVAVIVQLTLTQTRTHESAHRYRSVAAWHNWYEYRANKRVKAWPKQKQKKGIRKNIHSVIGTQQEREREREGWGSTQSTTAMRSDRQSYLCGMCGNTCWHCCRYRGVNTLNRLQIVYNWAAAAFGLTALISDCGVQCIINSRLLV